MASINLEKVKTLYGNSTDLQGQFVDYLRNVESELDFSKFEGLDNQAIFTNLMESGRKEIKVNPNNPAKPLDYRPRREQTYRELKALDDEINNQPFYKDLAMRATQVLDQINPTPFRQKELETRRHKAQEILNHLKKSGVTSEQFAKEYGDSPFLREAYFENQDIFSNIFDLSHDTSAALFGGKNAQAKAYDFELESYNTYKTIAQRKLDNPSNYYKLAPHERATIEQRVGAIGSWWRNNSDKELVDYYLDLENAKESASNFVSAQKRLENVNSNEQFLGLIGALKHGKEFDKKQKAMIDDYAIVAKELGFDTLAYNKTGLYFIKDEKAYKVEQGLWDEIKGVFKDNIGSLAGAIAGAEYGYKKGKFKGMVAYGAAGAFGGGVTDSMIADVLANKRVDLAQALIHGAQEGALNLAADAVLKVAGTAIKTLNPEKLKNIAGTAIDYTPVLGFISRAHDGNKAAAQKLINTTLPKEVQAELKELESIFGASVEIGQANTSKAAKALESIKQHLGSDSTLAKGAQKFYDTFAFTDQKQAQKDFIRAIRADESGNLTAFLSEAANASPVLQKSLQAVLGQTTEKLLHQLERFELAPNTIKDVFNNFEKGTKDSYKQAVEDILQGVYDDSYRVVLSREKPNTPEHLELGEVSKFNTQSYEGFKQKLLDSGVMVEDSAKFLHFVESSIYNPKGATFESLNNALKTINAYHKQATDPNFRSFVKDAVNGFIKRDIQAGIEAIFAQNKALYNDARTLFDTALSDYAKMKETLKLVDKLKVRDKTKSYEQVAESLSRFFLAQGDSIPNFEALLGSLPKSAREQVELKLLQDMLEISLVRYGESSALDSSEFFKRLDPLKAHFHSKSAQDFIAIAQDFHTLFRNDAKILSSLAPTTTEKMGSSIATTLEGAIKFQVIKALFANIVRLLPHIPFAKGLNEKVQGAALRFHLKKALDSSLSVGEFKLELQARAIKGDFTNATREQIAKILGQVDSAQGELERAATPSTTKQAQQVESNSLDSTPIADFGENFSEFRGQGAKAVEKVLQERNGQVQGAFYRDELGEIDVVWGDEKIGLQKIVEKHLNDFEKFDGNNPFEKLTNAINEIVESGKLISENGVDTLWHKKGDEYYLVGISKGFKGQGENNWIITSYKKTKGKIPNEIKGDTANLSAYSDEFNPLLTSKDEPLNSSTNSTTLNPLEQAKLDKLAKKAEQEAAQEAKEQAAREQAQAIKEHNDTHQRLKDQALGKAINDRLIKHKDPIALKHTNLPRESIAISDDEIIPLDLVVVKASDIEPNFYASEFQPRTSKNTQVIEAIARNFNPELVLGRGGYKDLPIINKEGKVIIGNHRVQGFKDFSQESRAAYESAIKDRYGIELAPDELLLRIPSDSTISDEKLLAIAFHSNKDDIKNIGDKVSAALGKYDQAIKELPNTPFTSESVEELKSKVAHALAKDEPLPDEREANLALLASLARSSEQSDIIKALDSLPKILAPQEKQALQNMFIDNAGSFFNLSRNTLEYGLRNMDLRPYIAESIESTAHALQKERWQNFEQLNQNIKYLLDSTDERGLNPMLESGLSSYDDVIAQALGASLARFARLENPSSNLYEALKNAPKELEALHAPAFDFESGGVTAGKRLQDMDILDLVDYLARSGEASQALREFVDLLPSFRQKWQNARASLAQSTPPKATPAEPAPKMDSNTPPQKTTPYTDTQGHTHQIPEPIAQKWLETFGLKDLQEPYTPKFSEQVAQALESILQGEQIALSANSLVKLMQRDRLEFLPYIKETLETPNAVVKQVDGAIIFAKDYRDEKLGKFFASVSKNDQGEWIISSNAPKNLNNLQNKIKEGGEVLYSDLPELPIIAKPDLTAKALNSEASKSDSTTKTFNQDIAKLKEIYNHAMTTGLENAKKDLELRQKAGVTISDEQDYIMRKAKPQAFRDLEIEYFNKELPKEVQEMLATFPQNKTIKNAEKIKPYKTDNDYINAVKQEMLEKYKGNGFVQVDAKLHREVDEIAKNIALSEKKNKYELKPNQKKDAREKATLQLRKDLMAGNNYDEIARLSSESFLKETRESIEIDITNSYSSVIREFGTNYAEHYHSGETAIAKLINEAQAHKESGAKGEYKGQVAGAFHRDDIGDITLAWGEKGTGRSDGWGLSKIAEYHPEVLDKLDKLIQDLPIVKETENRYKLDNGDFFISIRKDFDGQKQNWVLTALERDESIARRRTDLPSSQSEAEKTTSANASADSTTKTFNQADIKLESLDDFVGYARLAGFENLSPQELERAHKHILTNLEKLRC